MRCEFEVDPFATDDGGQCENEATVMSSFRSTVDGRAEVSPRCHRCAALTNKFWTLIDSEPMPTKEEA